MLIYALLICLPMLAFGQDILANQEFIRFDVDGDGNIEPREVQQYFRRFDSDGDGRISRQEYRHEVDTHHIVNSAVHQTLTRLFDELDYNNDNHIDQSDFNKFFHNADTNQNDLVNHAEFVNYFLQLTGGF
ncbi:calmodulin-like protein 5 isoform X2 [Biomphalaria pfeifferi]|uniref:Calmodulin-like protein 5 isoform X2 n=1 Tax=Biomphalaria pfeifferi TaxID=112525 RepID=A0AAD8AUH4_BIOPF|nr:calmodulin-like protein 5 isoform X2 [Biomphalaria pfeifferi]